MKMEIQMIAVTALDCPGPRQAPPKGDFYHFAEISSVDELVILKQVRTFKEIQVAPAGNMYSFKGAFPFELLPALEELNLELSRPYPWTIPIVVEICIGLEINDYLPAEF
jgi:coenzyme PQQ precursor peptide PqqA